MEDLSKDLLDDVWKVTVNLSFIFMVLFMASNGYESGIIKNATFLYTCIQTPKKKYQSEETEWCLNYVIDKATYKELKKAFPKLKINEFSNEEFIEKFQIDVPFPEQEDQYVGKIQRNTVKSNGVPVEEDKAPRVIFTKPDGTNVNITKKVLVGNGSVGDIIYFVSDTQYGRYPKLKDVIVSKLVPYEHKSNGTFLEVVDAEDEDLDSLLGVKGLNKQAEALEKADKGTTSTSKAAGGITMDDLEEAPAKTAKAKSEESKPITDDDFPWD